jgi:signal transduction histidine kinase
MHGPSPTDAELQQQIELLERQLREAQRLTALGELLGTTTHEFNNVLMSILNYAKLGLRHNDDATRTRSLEKILAAGQRAARITKTVLGAARNRGELPEPTDLAALADDVLVLLERELRRYRIAVETDFQPAPPAMVVGNQIQQVLINLLVNARQAMADGGRVIVRVRHDTATDTVDLTVRDSGTGIPPEQLPRIFDRYYTTKSGPDATGKGGTGLGLAACREIIEAHHGRIRVESTVGKGTAFTLKLPVARSAAIAPLTPANAAIIPNTLPAT